LFATLLQIYNASHSSLHNYKAAKKHEVQGSGIHSDKEKAKTVNVLTFASHFFSSSG